MIRPQRVEIYFKGEGVKERRRHWVEIGHLVKRMTNRLWQAWLVYHFQASSIQKIQERIEAFREWEKMGETKEGKSKRGKKPKWGVEPCDKELTRHLYHVLAEEFPTVTSRTRTLLQNKWRSTLTKRKAISGNSGNFPYWAAILFANEAHPSFTRAQPIPFDKENAIIYREGGKYFVRLRIERVVETGKSIDDHCELVLGNPRAARVRALFDRLIEGQGKPAKENAWLFKGSTLLFSNGKWYMHVSYDRPIEAEATGDREKQLLIVAGKTSPWLLYTQKRLGNGRINAFRFGGRGRMVEWCRTSLQQQRLSRQEHYKWGSQNQKGHGRNRAISIWTKIHDQWQHFQKEFNGQFIKKVIDLAIDRGYGTIMFYQPVEKQRDKTFLGSVGRDSRSRMTWDWGRVAHSLASKCEEHKIEFVVKKSKTNAELTDAITCSKVRKTG